MTPVAAAIAHHRWDDVHVPSRIRNSPTNPFNPGSPMEENVATRKSPVVTGTTPAIPP
jgi:hypothetical protein